VLVFLFGACIPVGSLLTLADRFTGAALGGQGLRCFSSVWTFLFGGAQVKLDFVARGVYLRGRKVGGTDNIDYSDDPGYVPGVFAWSL
jgi:hypothetical protein